MVNSALLAAFSVGVACGLAFFLLRLQRQVAGIYRNVDRLQAGDVLFLLCDVQEKFRDIIDKFSHVTATAKALLACAESMNIPVIVTEQYPKFFQNTVAELDVSRAKVFAKTKFSMCTDEVMAHVHTLGRKSAVLFGLETHVCVQQTALDLLARGFIVYVVADGVSSQRAPDRAVALQRMQQAGAYVTTAESLLFELLRSKEAPDFKVVSKLAKDLGQADCERLH